LDAPPVAANEKEADMSTKTQTGAEALRSVAARMIQIQVVTFVAMIAVAAGGSWGSGAIGARLKSVHDDGVVPLLQLAVVDELYAVYGAEALHDAQAPFPDQLTISERLSRAREEASVSWNAYLTTYLTEEETALIAEVMEAKLAADAILDKMLAAVTTQDAVASRALLEGDYFPAIHPLREALRHLKAYQQHEAERLTVDRLAVASTVSRGSAIVSGLVIALSLGLVLAYGRRLRRNLLVAASLAEAVAIGDIRSPVAGRRSTCRAGTRWAMSVEPSTRWPRRFEAS
jgi:hypothetical protein